MTILYNCKHVNENEYRISKFDDESLVASYLCTFETCDCPAGQRPTCRHRQMLPRFIGREAVDTGWWFDFDRGGWVDMRTEDELHQGVEPEPHSTTVSAEDFESSDVGSNPAGVARDNAKWRRF